MLNNALSLMKRTIALVFLPALLMFLTAPLHGQTAAAMDDLLDSRAVTWAQACGFVLPAAEMLNESAGAGAAFAAARDRGWLPKGAAADSPVTLGGLSYLALNAFSLKKSLLFTLFPGPRYAYRQLEYLDLLPGLRDPALNVSGERLVQILGRILSYSGEGDPVPATEQNPVGEPAAPRTDSMLEQREQMAREIQGELETRGVADTTVRVVEEGIAISLNNIQFLPDDTALTEAERIKLMRVAVILNRYPGRKILVGGHTAQAGTVEGRQLVSTQRAQVVADFLIFLESRNPEDIIVQGYGSERPLGDTGTAEDLALNRRVEITILDD